MLNGEPIGYAQSYVALEAGTDGGKKKTDPGVRGIDQSLANASQLGKGFGTKLVRALVELLFNDPEVTKIQTDPRRATCERSDATRKLFGEARYRNHPRWSSRVHGSNTPGIRANTQCCLTLPSRGTSKGWRGRPSCQTLNIMREAVIAEVSTQLSEVVGVIERHLEPTLLAVTFVRLRSGWRFQATQ